MTLLKKGLLALLVFTSVSFGAYAQFWFGPIVGGHLTSANFSASERKDTTDVKAQVNFHAGLAMDYSTESSFEVHTELVYTRIVNRSVTKELVDEIDPQTGALTGREVRVSTADSRFIHHFLTLPAMARVVVFQRSKVKFMAEAGPQLSYWLAGSGKLSSDDLDENGEGAVNVKVSFQDELPDESEVVADKLIVTKPNRLQYALGLGFGAVYDVSPERRLIVDIKYMFGQSWMAFNDGNRLVDIGDYREDLQYNTNMFSISAAYMFGWNPVLNRRGKSTSKVGKKQRRKK